LVRKIKEGEVTADLSEFLTKGANADVAAIDPQAMPVKAKGRFGSSDMDARYAGGTNTTGTRFQRCGPICY
jgi:hypothetical protein